MTDTSLLPSGLTPLLNRERAILEFNLRVLAQARRLDVPLLERLRYITIVSSNMDEFFEVRFADAISAMREATDDDDPQRGELRQVAAEAHALIDQMYAVFNHEVMPALQREGIVVINHEERSAAQRAWVASFFAREVQPLLLPVGLDPAHPFPLVANKSLNFIVKLGGQDAFGRENSIAIVKVPRALPRVIQMPPSVCENGTQAFVLLTSVIRGHLQELFGGVVQVGFDDRIVAKDFEEFLRAMAQHEGF